MDVTVIAESSGDRLHPVTAQLVGAAVTIGGTPTVLCAGGSVPRMLFRYQGSPR